MQYGRRWKGKDLTAILCKVATFFMDIYVNFTGYPYRVAILLQFSVNDDMTTDYTWNTKLAHKSAEWALHGVKPHNVPTFPSANFTHVLKAMLGRVHLRLLR